MYDGSVAKSVVSNHSDTIRRLISYICTAHILTFIIPNFRVQRSLLLLCGYSQRCLFFLKPRTRPESRVITPTLIILRARICKLCYFLLHSVFGTPDSKSSQTLTLLISLLKRDAQNKSYVCS